MGVTVRVRCGHCRSHDLAEVYGTNPQYWPRSGGPPVLPPGCLVSAAQNRCATAHHSTGTAAAARPTRSAAPSSLRRSPTPPAKPSRTGWCGCRYPAAAARVRGKSVQGAALAVLCPTRRGGPLARTTWLTPLVGRVGWEERPPWPCQRPSLGSSGLCKRGLPTTPDGRTPAKPTGPPDVQAGRSGGPMVETGLSGCRVRVRPGILLRLIVLAYPSSDPRRAKLIAKLYTVPRIQRPL